MTDGSWAKFMVVVTTDNHIWVRIGKQLWKFKLWISKQGTQKLRGNR